MQPPIEITAEEMQGFQALALEQAGIRLVEGKRLLVQNRLSRRLQARGMRSFGEYLALLGLTSESEELRQCIAALTTNETYFFRHANQWDFIQNRILPRPGSDQGRSWRAWSAACSSGEEPYSLGILLRSCMPDRAVSIEATDINQHVLDLAREGVYGEYALQKATEGCLARWFEPAGVRRWRIVPEVRQLVSFRCANLLEPGAGGGFDLVLLRNVLIYFDDRSKSRALEGVAKRLRPAGWLLLGGAESLGQRSNGFDYIAPGIYRRSAA